MPLERRGLNFVDAAGFARGARSAMRRRIRRPPAVRCPPSGR